MQMHMIGLMYAPSDKLTLYSMGSFLNNDMSLITRSKLNFQTNSNGFGDVKLGGLYQLFNVERRTLHLNIGVSLPSGSLIESGVTPASRPNETRLGYAMQQGSGTYDFNFGATYLNQYYNMSFGLQTSYLLRTGENSEGYTLGDTWNTTFWTAYHFIKNISGSVRLNYNDIQNIEGADVTFNPMMGTVFDAGNSGKKQLDFLVGANFAFFKGDLQGMRLSGEFGVPVYQDV
ncbi:MAG: hypothetical protein P8L42_06530 [Flavicella sp.]|nr:hypothetical protein [Flavicella sp.]